ncbi:MAG TPA: sulfite exporter TauE/SafE family protein [Bacteroidales bacterium]|nr:sulfite exporter TauE/SafE family protein [Bacteroidales bacterium]
MMLTAKQVILLVITGLLAGMVSGALGVGGAIIIIPFLVFFLGLSQQQAQGTSLMILVFPVGIFAVMNYAKNGYVNYPFALIVILAFLLGSYIGSVFAVNLPEKALQKGFAILLLFIGIKMLLGK